MTAPEHKNRVSGWRSCSPAVRLLAGISLGALLLGCHPAEVKDDSAFDVVIYVLDACRADRLGCYGYERPTSPTIDALAADPDSVVYTRHYVAGNWTKPATASLFTGSYVHQHGVTNRPAEVEGGLYRAEVLDDRFVTLAESFRSAGYATFGLVTSLNLSPRYQFDQGFDVYLDPEELKVGDAGRVSKLIDLIWGLETGYFAYVHQNACHYPFRLEDRDPEFMAEFGFSYDEKSRQAASIDFTGNEIRDAIVDGSVQLSEEDVRFLSLVYDAQLRKIDREVVGGLIDGLRRAGRWDRTLLILTADHGEELYEHDGYAHGFSMWEEVIHVPLIVKFPRGMRPSDLPKRIDALTSNVDYYPSLMKLLKRSLPDRLEGRSLWGPFEKDRFVFSQGLTDWQSPGATDWAVIQGGEKLIVERGERRLLFDLEADPKERQDVADSRPERVLSLMALGEAARAAAPTIGAPEIETELSPEVIERLRSLGYLE